MFRPVLFRGSDDFWHCVWNLDGKDGGATAHVATRDLVTWMRQSYYVNESELPIFKQEKIVEKRNNRQKAFISGSVETGSLHRVAWPLIDALIKKQQLTGYKNQLYAETTKEDPLRFTSLKPVSVSIKPDPSRAKKISTELVGAFFEDINYAADGGLYAELIQNRGFEYQRADNPRDTGWNAKKAWYVSGNGIQFYIDTVSPVHVHNPHYAVLEVSGKGGALLNGGFDGIAVHAGERFDLSMFARRLSGKIGKLTVRIIDKNGKVCGQTELKLSASNWRKYNAVITASSSARDAELAILPEGSGKMALDMISLFPQKTFKGRKNGLRRDLAQTIADLHPKFVRFPGGCLAHGDGIENIYHWKNTVGPLETRVPQRNIWGYHQSMGLGYFEYFQFCEDIGATPLPVVAAGVPCQNSGQHGHQLGGQQCGIPMSNMGDYVQDVLDLIEWANGDATTKWGKVRAAAGHPKPFNLKYIGIGNEDLISDVFEERFRLIYDAIKEKYPGITVIGTVGPFFEGTDYVEGWKLADKMHIPIVDEHYYVPPGWFIYNQDFYDKYDRSKSQVYLGEYAAHLPGRPNNLETALAEAIHLTALERNGDVVRMASYAPMLAKEGRTQWNPDLIYFNNTEVKPTAGYEVQKLFGQNTGDTYIPGAINYSDHWDKVQKRVAWSLVSNTEAKEMILKMVNLLPVKVETSFDWSGFDLSGASFTKTTLQGKPADKNNKPVVEESSAGEAAKLNIPPYSLTVMKIKLR
jgi:alpha-L-arabinofuranosidase